LTSVTAVQPERSRPRLGQLIEAHHFDAVVAVSLENVYYASGVPIMTQRLIPSRLAFVVATPDDEASMVVCSIEVAQVHLESWIRDVRGYTEFADSPVAVLADLLREKGLARGRIGIETAALGHRYFAELESLLPEATIVDGDELFLRARSVKSSAEIALYEHAAAATNRSIRDVFSAARIGDTEIQLAERLEERVRVEGADGAAFTVLATGLNARLAHPSPGLVELSAGDVLRTDFGGYFGARYAGYMTDLARTAIVGEPTGAQSSTYQRLFEVHLSLLEALRPGVAACDIFELARRGFEKRDLPFRMPHVGHSIGLSIHEEPMLSPMTTAELQEGMVLAVEPITITDDGIFHVEDLVTITADGARILSSAHDWAELMSVG
jgi:Xaa-Pro aminopeptidase